MTKTTAKSKTSKSAKAAKNTKSKEVNNEEIEEKDTLVENEIPVVESEDEEEAAEELDPSDIPLEEFMKDPERMAKLTEEAESEESTNWCPQCGDYTIFVDKVCTVCGFTKGARKNEDRDEKEESANFEIIPEDELVEGLGYGYDDESGDDY